MVDMLRVWWPVVLLAYVPLFVQTVMHIAITRAFRRLDESHPDDLPHTAGEWLDLEIARLGFTGRIRVFVPDDDKAQSLDAYHVRHASIQLSVETCFKRDPMHWAIAAHELGHARFKLEHPWLGELLVAAVVVKRIVVTVAIAFALGSVWFAVPGASDLARQLFLGAAALHLGTIFDEAMASRLAMRSLAESGDFSWSHLSSARRALALAFSTYVVAFAARLVLLTQWHIIEDLSRTPSVPPVATLTTLGSIAAAIASALVILHGIERLRGVIAPHRFPHHILNKAAASVALFVFVVLAWNTHADGDHVRLVMLALIPTSGWFITMLALPMILFEVLLLRRVTKALTIDATDRTEEYRRDKAAGVERRKHGNRVWSELVERAHEVHPAYAHRLHNLVLMCGVPLAIAYWL